VTSSAFPLPGDGSARDAGSGRVLRALPGGAGRSLELQADEALLELARGGDREAFGVLVERHHRMLAGLIRQRLGPRGPVEDLLQEVFAKSLAKLDDFGGRSAFATWAGAIALNLATDWQRKQARRRRLAPSADVEQDSVPSPGSDRPLRAVETREEAARARAAIDGLPLRMRLAVTLRIVEDLPYESVAERLGAPVTTVRTWVSRGLRQVRSVLEVPHDDA
jgi:RNA polymerase sigma-70 factor (ECF subfamily)